MNQDEPTLPVGIHGDPVFPGSLVEEVTEVNDPFEERLQLNVMAKPAAIGGYQTPLRSGIRWTFRSQNNGKTRFGDGGRS